MNHYICTGGCRGVSDALGVCQAQECPKHGQPLQECDCEDGTHNGLFREDHLAKSDSNPSAKSNNPKPTIYNIEGEARGYWFFEANFPIRLYDGNGNEIAVAIAQAEGEWMTENFVPFKAEMSFSKPVTERGVLILEKDNPSGLSENDDELRVPIIFGL